jgi:hypothetical protein
VSAVLRESARSIVDNYLGVESFEAGLVRMRAMTRAEYDETRLRAHRLTRDAAMLQRSMPRAAEQDAAYARRLRAAIAPPVDVAEAKREKRWLQVRAALQFGRTATAARRSALEIARAVRR